MNKTICILTVAFTIISNSIQAQNVNKIKASVSGNNIIVSYAISGAKFNQSFNISLYVSSDDGRTFEGPLQEVSGDVGEGIKKGNHKITWDVLKEMPFTEESLIFDVRAEVIEEAIKKSVFVSYVGNITTPIGLRVGMIGRVGWYAEGRMSLLATETVSYDYDGEKITNYDKPGYYEFNDNKGYSAMSIVGGVTFQPSWNFFLYIGAGYGKDYYIYEIDEFNYGDNTKIGQSWVKDINNSYSGIEVDAGAMVRIGKVLLSAGATTINFKIINWTAGVGISF